MGKLTTTEAATQLGCTRSAVRRAIRDGRIVAEKAGRDWLIDPADILPMCAEHRKPTGRPRRGYRGD